MQRQIEHCMRDYASRIRNTNDPAAIRKVLGQVQETAAEFLRQLEET